MVDNTDLDNAIDKRVKIIDSKLKDAFSSIKKDIKDIKNKTENKDSTKIEKKIEDLKRELSQKSNVIVKTDESAANKLRIKLAEIKNKQLLNEKIEAEKAKQQKLENKLQLRKQESKLWKKQSKTLTSIAHESSKNFTNFLKEIKKQQDTLVEQSKKDVTKVTSLYESKIVELELQHSLDKSAAEAKHAQELSELKNQQDELKSELYSMGKQLDKVQSRKESGNTGFWASLLSSSISTKQKPVIKAIKVKKTDQVSSEVQRKKRNAVLKFLIFLIPVVLIGYVLYANFVAAHSFNYSYDIGSEQDAKKPYLTPLNRVSDIINDSQGNYRNLTSQLVYFDVPIPLGSDSISIQARIKNPDTTSNVLIGVKDSSEWSYYTKIAYSALLESLPSPDYSDSNLTIWKINSDAQTISSISNIPTGANIATDLNIHLTPKLDSYDIKPLTINTVLRGGHTFYVYLNNSLELYVEKRDLNWYNGTDEMNISLYDLQDNLLGISTLADDGLDLTEHESNGTVIGRLDVYGINSGVYKLVFSDAEVLITKIKINTNKLVTNRLFLADADAYTLGGNKESTVFLRSNKESTVNFNTYHLNYLQNISINFDTLNLETVNTNYIYNLSVQDYSISAPKSDVIISSPSYISFSKENYFDPFLYSISPIPSIASELRGVDYILSSYIPTVKNEDWIITNTEFLLEDLYIQNGKLNILFNIPNLSGESNQTGKVSVDWINSTVNKNGLTTK